MEKLDYRVLEKEAHEYIFASDCGNILKAVFDFRTNRISYYVSAGGSNITEIFNNLKDAIKKYNLLPSPLSL